MWTSHLTSHFVPRGYKKHHNTPVCPMLMVIVDTDGPQSIKGGQQSQTRKQAREACGRIQEEASIVQGRDSS